MWNKISEHPKRQNVPLLCKYCIGTPLVTENRPKGHKHRHKNFGKVVVLTNVTFSEGQYRIIPVGKYHSAKPENLIAWMYLDDLLKVE